MKVSKHHRREILEQPFNKTRGNKSLTGFKMELD